MTQQHRVNVTQAYSGVPPESDEKYDDLNGEDEEGAESGWEDEEGGTSLFIDSRTGSPFEGSNFRMARRRRRPTRGAKKQIAPTRPTTMVKTASSKADEQLPTIAREDVVHGLVHGSLFTGKYALDIFKRALLLLRYPLSFLFCLYILAFILNKMEHTFKSILSPICIVPGLGKTRFCHTPTPSTLSNHRPARWADYPHLVDVESKTFEQLMSGVIGGSALSLEVKQAEMATTDLVALVRISDLKAKDTLASSLLAFIESAKKTGRGLQRLSSKVGGAVDSIMAANEYALKTIETARANEPSTLFFVLAAVIPWTPTRKPTSIVVTETFEEAMNTLSNHLQRLIVEAEVNDKNLNDLEERLNSLHELVSREDSSISSAKSDLLAELWTILGGNRKKLRNFDSHLALLKDLVMYRKQAAVHVAAALQTLRGMADDMEDMRERVASPNLAGSSVTVEVHMKSIEHGLERLKEGRIRASKLEQEAMRKVLSSIGVEDE